MDRRVHRRGGERRYVVPLRIAPVLFRRHSALFGYPESVGSCPPAPARTHRRWAFDSFAPAQAIRWLHRRVERIRSIAPERERHYKEQQKREHCKGDQRTVEESQNYGIAGFRGTAHIDKR